MTTVLCVCFAKFVRDLHNMFLAVLRALKAWEDESCLLFPVRHRRQPRDT